MTRTSKNEYDRDGNLVWGYDYDLQCWVTDYVIEDCAHQYSFKCHCNGREYAGEDIRVVRKELIRLGLKDLVREKNLTHVIEGGSD